MGRAAARDHLPSDMSTLLDSWSPPGGRMELVKLLEALIKLGGSDLHLQAGAPPMLRVGGDLKPLETPPLEDSQIREYMRQMSPSQAQVRLEEKRSADFGFELTGAARFRVNAFYERQRLALAFRRIPIAIPAFP